MEFAKENYLKKLNTKGCCFFCLKNENVAKISKDFKVSSMKSTFMGSLLRHLQIGEGTVPWSSQIEADLCNRCEETVTRFSVLCQQLEKVQMEMNYILERINQCVSESAKTPDLVQVYSKRMTSDPEALSQLVFVDNLRKELAKKFLTRQTIIPCPRINLRRTVILQVKAIKEEVKDQSEIKEEDSPPHSPSSPPPQSLELADFKVENKNEPFANSSNQYEKRTVKNTHPKGWIGSKTKTGKRFCQFYRKDSTTGMIHCNKCDRKSLHRGIIKQHFETIHLKRKYKCDLCKVKVFTDRSNLRRHMKPCQQIPAKELAKEKDPEFKFICKLCGKRFKFKNYLYGHQLNVHRNVNRYSCDLCEKKFKSTPSLTDHRDTVHFGRRITCKLCGNIYRSKSTHRLHEKRCLLKNPNNPVVV